MNNKLLFVAGLVITGMCTVAAANSPQALPSQPSPSSEHVVSTGRQTTLQAAKARSEAADEFNEIVCKNLVVTGSRMPRKLCHTRGEWMAMDAGSDQFMEDLEAGSGMRPLGLDELGRSSRPPYADSVFSNPGGARGGSSPPML